MSSSRLNSLRHLISSTQAQESLEPGDLAALAMFVADAALANDEPVLDELVEFLRRAPAIETESNGDQQDLRLRLEGVLQVAELAVERLVPDSLLADVSPGSHAHSMLAQIQERPGVRNRDLADTLDLHETEVSRVGRSLLQAGLAQRRRVGTSNYWEITPRGAKALASVQTYAAVSDIVGRDDDLTSEDTLRDKVTSFIEGLETQAETSSPADVRSLTELLRLSSVRADDEMSVRIIDCIETDFHALCRHAPVTPAYHADAKIQQISPTATRIYGAEPLEDLVAQVRRRRSVLAMSEN